MRRFRSIDLRLTAAVAALSLLLGGCGGPDVPLGLFVKEEKVGIALSSGEVEEEAAVVEERPPGADPFNPGFPSFVVPPPPLAPDRVGDVRDRVPPSGEDVPPPPRPAEACPKPSADASPALIASSSVSAPPKEGDYEFRRTGTARVGGVATSLDAVVTRRIADVRQTETARQVRWRFNVLQREAGVVSTRDGTRVDAVTTTVYEIDQNPTAEVPEQPGGDVAQTAGLKIAAINTDAEAGADSFQPQPPVRLMMLPASAKGYDEHGAGTDPLTGTRMETTFRTHPRVDVEGCGVVYQAWRQRVQGVYYTGASPQAPGARPVYFVAVIDVATQYGGMVLNDEVHLSDRPPVDARAVEWDLPDGNAFDVRSRTTINSIEAKQ